MPPDCYSQPRRVFAISITTSPRRDIFADDWLAAVSCALLVERCDAASAQLYAYCLMPDHAHAVIGVGEVSLPQLLGSWKSLVAAARRRSGASGSIWQRGFWDAGARGEKAVFEASLYVLENPVRAGLVLDWRAYPWCGSSVWDL